MKYWILTSEFPPEFGGGIATYCREAASALTQAGHEVVVFVPQKDGSATELESESCCGATIFRVPLVSDRRLRQTLGHAHLLSLSLANAVEERLELGVSPPDIIETQEYLGLGYFLMKRKLLGDEPLASIPIVVVCHTPAFELTRINEEPSYKFPSYWIGQTERFTLKAADALVSPSQFLADRIAAESGREVTVIPSPMAVPVRQPGHKQSAEFDLVYLGRYEVRKGVVALLEGMERLWSQGHRIRLRMIGGDTVWEARQVSTKEWIRHRYQPWIGRQLLVLDESVPPDQVAGELRRAKAAVVPSLYENFPNTCLEAMAQGLPILASSSGGQAEIVGDNGKCGRLFDWSVPGDFERAALAIASLSTRERTDAGSNAATRVAALCDPAKFASARIKHAKRLVAEHAGLPADYPFVSGTPKSSRRAREERAGLLSVVVPYHNLGRYLAETVRSAMASTYPNIEVIIVDDGSNDEQSLNVLEEVDGQTWRFPVRVISRENKGLPQTRNDGAEEAQGEFLAFLDADDLVQPEYYARCVDVLRRYRNVSYVYSWLNYIGESDGCWANFDTGFPYFLCANMLSAFALFRRRSFLQHGRNNPEMKYGLEDYESALRMAAAGQYGVSIPEFLVDYRVRRDSMSRAVGQETAIWQRERLSELNEDLYRRWGPEVFRLMNANGPGWLWSNGSLSYPPVAHVGSNVVQRKMAAIREQLGPDEIHAIVGLLDDPDVVWALRMALRRGWHRPGKTIARTLSAARKSIRRTPQNQ